jgi:4-hydroxybenzoate polyprenyltransferase
MNIEPETRNDVEIKSCRVFFETPNILMLSSLFFITNAVTAFVNEYYLYSLLFFNLTITSLMVHHYNNVYTNVIDKVAVLSIVLYGGYLLYNKINTNKWMNIFAIIISFLFCIYLYIYGFIIKEYCFCDEKYVSQMYHFILHAISSIGHHCIIYL